MLRHGCQLWDSFSICAASGSSCVDQCSAFKNPNSSKEVRHKGAAHPLHVAYLQLEKDLESLSHP